MCRDSTNPLNPSLTTVPTPVVWLLRVPLMFVSTLAKGLSRLRMVPRANVCREQVLALGARRVIGWGVVMYSFPPSRRPQGGVSTVWGAKVKLAGTFVARSLLPCAGCVLIKAWLTAAYASSFFFSFSFSLQTKSKHLSLNMFSSVSASLAGVSTTARYGAAAAATFAVGGAVAYRSFTASA